MCICARKGLWRGSAVAERVRKKDNNIIIPIYLNISQKCVNIGRKELEIYYEVLQNADKNWHFVEYGGSSD